MKVKEFIEKYKIDVNYADDRKLINKYADNELLAYYYAGSSAGGVKRLKWWGSGDSYPSTSLIMFNSARKLICLLDGIRIEPHSAIQLFNNFSTDIKPINAELMTSFVKLNSNSKAKCMLCGESGFKKGMWCAEEVSSAWRSNLSYRKIHIDCWIDANKKALSEFKWVTPKIRRQLKQQMVLESV
jgi:hypothetical protein